LETTLLIKIRKPVKWRLPFAVTNAVLECLNYVRRISQQLITRTTKIVGLVSKQSPNITHALCFT
jgi:hypothetical protein